MSGGRKDARADSAGFLDAWDARTGVSLARSPLALSAGRSSSGPAISAAFGGFEVY